MKVEIIPCLQDNYSYLIIDNEKQEACVVDPSEAKPIINYLNDKNIKLKYILNTHHHYDHVGGNTELKKKFGSVVLGFNGDAKRIPEIDILKLKLFIFLDTQQDIFVFIFLKKTYYSLEIHSFHLGVVEFLRVHMNKCMTL